MLPPLLAAAAACATLGTFQSARPIDRHTVEVGVEASGLRTSTPANGRESTTPASLSVRYAVDDRTELGVRAGFTAPELAVKRLLTSPDARNAVSFAPTVGVFPTDLHGIPMIVAQGTLPLLIGLETGRALEWVVAPKLAWTYGHHRELRAWGALVSAGVGTGCSIRLLRGVHVMPDLVVLVPLAYAGTGIAGLGGGWVAQAGVGARFGGERR